MTKTVQRGYVPTDEIEFNATSQTLLQKIQRDIFYLINNGYDLESSTTFTCNRFQLSARQRMALLRSTSSREQLINRKQKQVEATEQNLFHQTLHIDGFNLIIPLEIALSGTTLLQCMDGTIRDLAGLHGTYRLIDKTDAAIPLVLQKLKTLGIEKAIFYLDAPISNSGRLKQRILELSSGYPFSVEVPLYPNVDKILYEKDLVCSSDGIILDHCMRWVNLCRMVIDHAFPNYPYIDLTGNELHTNF